MNSLSADECRESVHLDAFNACQQIADIALTVGVALASYDTDSAAAMRDVMHTAQDVRDYAKRVAEETTGPAA